MVKAISRWQSLRLMVYPNQPAQAPAPTAPMFITHKQDPISPTVVQLVLQRLRRDSDIPFSAYDLRHAFILRMVSQGHPPTHIAAMLGRPLSRMIRVYCDLQGAMADEVL
ncbi:MAG: tyrosine-type recombinase/integrase [Anaerolineae bacterium]|nr:tyrosine-type recombinase/integrase [Anaerolineae bacterium]